MNSTLPSLLAEQGLVILDGALATELESRGADLKDPLWSARLLIERPELIREVHLDYFRAGADVATTASYQASFEGFARRGIGFDEAAALMRLSVQLAAEARDAFWAEPANRVGRHRPLVAASVGPYGAMLADGSEYRGYPGVTRAQLAAFHRPRLEVLAASGADLLACETLPGLDEALAIASLLPALALPAWISFSCRDGEHVSQGERFADCVAALDGLPGVAAVGLNCTAPQHVPALVAAAQARTRLPIVVYPNSGEQWDGVAKCWHGVRDAEDFAAQALRWQRGGARLIGGCCRTGPGEIRALRAAVLAAG
ncbi:homocysteine S-methyltransferase [Rubrivivax gelatinosus]|uniref:Homocysteine S-methyltransferase n=1 Tax=Rubrivivax gelatinosus TaxID=28068 RepID=A0ABS1DXV1_RUBGE|nr:homocysteine S-methyltransferase [Rubrivivax gelatinosus]MBK1714569.1 homocysteine S-methyltransferase [Rubrivivax gelatinosus]